MTIPSAESQPSGYRPKIGRVYIRAGNAVKRLVKALWEKDFYAFLLAIVIIDTLVLRSYLALGLFQVADLVIPFSSSGQLYYGLFSAWNFQSGGTPGGYALWILFEGALGSLTPTPSFIEKALYFSALPIASISEYLFLRHFGLPKIWLWGGALLYQFSPWLVGEFLAGEPAFVWLYAFLPLYCWLLAITSDSPSRLLGYVGLAWVVSIATAFTLQATLVYIVVGIPFFVRLLVNTNFRSALKVFAGWILVFLTAIAANLTSIVTYLGTYFGYQTAAQSHGIESVLVGPNPQQYWLMLLALFGGVAILLLISQDFTPHRENTLILTTVLVASVLMVLFFSIPSAVSAWALVKIPVLTPFLDVDKFVLFGWNTTLLVTVFRGADISQSMRLSRFKASGPAKADSFPGRAEVPQSLLLRRPISWIAISISALLVTSAFGSIQPQSENLNAVSFLTTKAPFSASQIPMSYLELKSFLERNGASFGLSFRTIVLPQNPGSIVPAFIGEQLIPGFVEPSGLQYNLTLAISQNLSTMADELSLAGVKFVALIPSPSNPWWPDIASGNPEAVQIWPGGWIPVGNETAYARLVESNRALVIVYRSNDLLILQNMNYEGSAISYESMKSMLEVTEGDSIGVTNLTPISPDAVNNGSVLTRSSWNTGSTANGTLLPNGTLFIPPGSVGTYVTQDVQINPNETYLLAFHLMSTNTYSGYPTVGFPTYAGVYWDTVDSSYERPTGDALFPAVYGAVNESYQFVFQSPSGRSPVHAALYLFAEPPQPSVGQAVFIRFSNVSLFAISGGDLFTSMVSGLQPVLQGPTVLRFDLSPLTTLSYVTVSTAFDSGWRATSETGDSLAIISGPFGLLTVLVPSGTQGFRLSFLPQDPYNDELVIVLLTWATLAGVIAILGARALLIKRTPRSDAGGNHHPTTREDI